MIIVTFTVLPNEKDGIFKKYSYSLPSNELNKLNFSDDVGVIVTAIACDINAENDTCPESKATPLEQFAGAVNAVINNIVKGGFSALITIYKSVGLGKVLIEETGRQFGLPTIIIDIVVSMLFITILITILLLIFNRSDVQ